MISDELFMQRALYLASLGSGYVAPNPLVGCVIVQNNKIIGEGWHKKWGEAHAEVNAISSVTDQSTLQQATVYINLEPCVHYGKTSPCVDLLIQRGIKRVVLSNIDPNPLVGGKGIAKLEKAGIVVKKELLNREGAELNKRFFTFYEKKRPYIILKWAQTSDKFIARENYESKWISNKYARKIAHKWRSEEDAIMVGKQTVAHDNPKLTTRKWCGHNSIRIMIDRFLKLDNNLHLFDRSEPTICYNLLKEKTDHNLSFVRLKEQAFITQVVDDMYRRNIQSVMIEGGSCMLTLFIKAGLWDEARVFFSLQSFGRGISAPIIQGTLVEERTVFDNILKIYTNTHVQTL